jgi:hypothetical protein
MKHSKDSLTKEELDQRFIVSASLNKKAILLVRQEWTPEGILDLEYGSHSDNFHSVGRLTLFHLDKKGKRKRLDIHHQFMEDKENAGVIFRIYKSKKGYSVWAKTLDKQEFNMLITRP